MDVGAKKKEILRLIAKINRGSPFTKALPEHKHAQADSAAARALSNSLTARRHALEEIKRKRMQLEREYLQLEEAFPTFQSVVKQIRTSESIQRRHGERASLGAELEGDWTFSGLIQEGLLADIFQLISSNIMSGVITVSSEDLQIHIYYLEGEIFHASGEGIAQGVQGESAFYAAMALPEGRFYFKETQELPQEKSIESKTQFLILEALRQIDESAREDAAAPTG